LLGDLIILSNNYSEKTISLMDDILEIEKGSKNPINLATSKNSDKNI